MSNNCNFTATECPCCSSRKFSHSPSILSPFLAKKIFGWEVVDIDESWGMRDIKNGTAYPLCSSIQCQDCSFLFLDMRFSDSELSRYYEDYQSEEFFIEREEYEPSFIERRKKFLPGAGDIADVFKYMNVIEDFISSRTGEIVSVLDYGGKDGLNTPLSDSCKTHHILDFNTGTPIKGSSVSIGEASSHKYDLVVLRHVLEHYPYPEIILDKIKPLLNKGGVLYIELPFEKLMEDNPGNQSIHHLKKLWHEHINFFSIDAIEALLKRKQFNILDSKLFKIVESSRVHLMYLVALEDLER
jgi:SAM-dependent methyltransferase